MRKLLLFNIILLISISTMAQEQTTKPVDPKPAYTKFEISAAYMFNVSSKAYRNDFGFVDFSYRFTKLIGLRAAFGMGNTYQANNPTAYSGTISVTANPINEKSNFSLVPSLGVGLSWNYPIENPKAGANVFLDLTVLAKYKITDLLYCGVELKTICYGIKNADLLAGVRIGLNF